MTALRFVVVPPEGLAPYVEGLRALERAVTYPIDDGRDRFYIDHGAAYGAFYAGLGSKARFVLALDGDRPVGLLAGALKATWDARGRRQDAAYLGDLKLAPAWRGRGVMARLMWWGLRQVATNPDLRGWRVAFGAAMRGERGDLSRAATGSSPMRWMRPAARLSLWFTSVEALRALPAGGPASPTSPGLLLSAPDAPPFTDTDGRKDLRLVSSGARWPLVHLPAPPTAWGPDGLSGWLRASGEALAAARPDATVCFALDERLTDATGWLVANGLPVGATATVYVWGWPHRVAAFLRGAQWVHLATSEI